MTIPRQPSLFGDEAENEPSALVSIAAVSSARTAAQRSFNRLVERIGRLRDALVAWDAYIPRFQQRVLSELAPTEDAIASAQRRLVLQLDALLLDKTQRLSRAHRRKSRDLLLSLAEDLLSTGTAPEIEAAHDRHAEVSRAEQQQFDVEFGKEMAAQIFGADAVKGHNAKSMEEVFQHAGERYAQEGGVPPNTRPGRQSRGKNKRQQAAAARAEAAREAAMLTVREVYRRLARTLHPDREPDAAERDRKTRLMQRANQAYEHNDLLTLLALQLEIEQIDATTLATLPDDRLQHYSHVLKEQVAALNAQIDDRLAPFRFQFDLRWGNITQARIDQALAGRIFEAGNMLKELEDACNGLADPKTRRATLESLPDPSEGNEGLDEIVAIAEMMMGEMARDAPPRKRAAAKGKGSGKRKKGKKRG